MLAQPGLKKKAEGSIELEVQRQTADVFADKLIIEEIGILRRALQADEKRFERVGRESMRLEKSARADMEQSVAREKMRLVMAAGPKRKLKPGKHRKAADEPGKHG
ncbi:MAG: hypothetical protein QXG98_02045 [Candidatus Micrarchaeia archaeon]